MRIFSCLAAIAIAAFCMGDLMAQCSGCGSSYAAPAVPMMTSYASVGCGGCYQTSMSPSVSYGSGCNSCGTVQPAAYSFQPTSGCSSCGVSAPVVSSYPSSGCSSCGVNAPVVSNYQPSYQSTGCSSCGTSVPMSAPVASYQPMQSFGCSSCGTSMPSYNTVGTMVPQTFTSAPMSYGSGCSSCGSMSYGTYPANVNYAPTYGSSCGCSACSGGISYGVSGSVIQGGCSDCVGGSVPFAEGQIIEGTPVPSEVQGEAAPSEEKVDVPPTPEDA